jgi:hypothetical protein
MPHQTFKNKREWEAFLGTARAHVCLCLSGKFGSRLPRAGSLRFFLWYPRHHDSLSQIDSEISKIFHHKQLSAWLLSRLFTERRARGVALHTHSPSYICESIKFRAPSSRRNRNLRSVLSHPTHKKTWKKNDFTQFFPLESKKWNERTRRSAKCTCLECNWRVIAVGGMLSW